jgi:hypothetical protein
VLTRAISELLPEGVTVIATDLSADMIEFAAAQVGAGE